MLTRFEKSLIYHQRIFAFLNDFENLDKSNSVFYVSYYLKSGPNKIKNICFGLGKIIVNKINIQFCINYNYINYNYSLPKPKGHFRSNKLLIFWQSKFADDSDTMNRVRKITMSKQ